MSSQAGRDSRSESVRTKIKEFKWVLVSGDLVSVCQHFIWRTYHKFRTQDSSCVIVNQVPSLPYLHMPSRVSRNLLTRDTTHSLPGGRIEFEALPHRNHLRLQCCRRGFVRDTQLSVSRNVMVLNLSSRQPVLNNGVRHVRVRWAGGLLALYKL